MPHVFISHHSADKAQVRRLVRALSLAGIQVWVDYAQLRPDSRWKVEIPQALTDSVFVLACVGAHGVGPWHLRELELAQGLGVDIRVVCLPGWTEEKGRLGFDDVTAYDLREDPASRGWGLGLESLVLLLGRPMSGGATPTSAMPTGPDPGASHAPEGHFDGCPHPGSTAMYDVRDEGWFFGREHATTKILALLREHRWLWLVGNSGSGKSSIARAGVMAHWKRSTHGRGLTTSFTASNDGVKDLVGALKRICDLPPGTAVQSDSSQLLRDKFGEETAEAQVLIVVDQAERIFARSGLRGSNERMVAELRDLLDDAELPARVHVLAVLRAEYGANVTANSTLPWGARYSLPAMTASELRDAITLPLRNAGGGMDPSLADALVRELVEQPEHGLAMMQQLVRRAWIDTDAPAKTITLTTLQTPWLRRALAGWLGNERDEADPRDTGRYDALAELEADEHRLDALVMALVEVDDLRQPRPRFLPRNGEIVDLQEDAQLLLDLGMLVRARIVFTTAADPSPRDGEQPQAGWCLVHALILKEWRALADAIQGRCREALCNRGIIEFKERHGMTPQTASLLRAVAGLDVTEQGEPDELALLSSSAQLDRPGVALDLVMRKAQLVEEHRARRSKRAARSAWRTLIAIVLMIAMSLILS